MNLLNRFTTGRSGLYLAALFSAVFVTALIFASAGTGYAAEIAVLPFAAGAGADAPLSLALGGLIVTQASLESIRRQFSRLYEAGFGMADHFWDQVAMEVMSNTGSNVYGWLGQWPQFREWIGDRVFNDLKEHAYTLQNRKFESSVAVGRDQIEDDNLGVYRPMVKEMGRATSVFPDELVGECIANGEVKLCYDGQPFFDTEHPVYAKTDGTGANTPVSNLLGTGTDPAWYLLDTSREVKPFIYQIRRKPEFTMMTALTDEAVFTSGSFRMGVSLRAEAGFGLWQMAIKSTQPLTAANFEAARKLMRSFKADGGRPLGCKPNVLLCGTQLEPEAEKILVRDRIDGGDTNVNRGKAKIISTEWLDD